MRILSLAVAAFALAAFVVGLRSPDVGVFLFSGAALLCAVATYLSRGISVFLRIFVAIFAVETILFGIAYLADELGFWPAAYADYALPSSLPLTVALFGSFAFAVSFVPVIRKMTNIADPYFHERAPTLARIWPFRSFTIAQNHLATAALVFLIVINQVEVALDVRLSFFSRDFYNAMQEKNLPEFWSQLFLVFLPFATILIASLVIEYVVTSTFVIRWRRWLTARYIGRWLGGGAHYPMALAASPADNPDQRISEDITASSTAAAPEPASTATRSPCCRTLTSLVSYAIVLWGLSESSPCPERTTSFPAFCSGRPRLRGAGHRHHPSDRPIPHSRSTSSSSSMKRTSALAWRGSREYSEQIALLRGETGRDRRGDGPLRGYLRQLHAIVHVRKRLAHLHQRLRPDQPIFSDYHRRAVLFRGQDPARRVDAGRARVRQRQHLAQLLRLAICRAWPTSKPYSIV